MDRIRAAAAPISAAFLALFTLFAAAEVGAQSLKTVDAAELERLIGEARDQGAKVVVIETPAGAGAAQGGAAEAQLSAVVEDQALQVRARFREILAGASQFADRAGETVRQYDPGGSMYWPLPAALLAVLFLAVGYGAERMFNAWGRSHFQHLFNPTPESEVEKISYLLLRGLMQTVAIALGLAVALLVGLAFDQGETHVRNTQLIIILGVTIVRAMAVFFQNLFAYGTPSHRLLHLSDADAVRMHRGLMGILVIGAISIGMCLWMEALALNRDAHVLALMVTTLLATVLLSGFAIVERRTVAGMILGAGAVEAKPGFVRLVAAVWHILAVLYFVVAWMVSSVRLILDLPNALGLVGDPVLIILFAIAGYGAALLLIEWLFTRRAAQRGQAAVADDVDLDVADETAAEDALTEAPAHGFKELAEHAAAVMTVAISIWLIFDLWGVNLTEDGGILHSLWEILLIGFLAYLAFAGVRIAIDRKIAEEGGFDEEPEPGEEGGAQGTSRLATLLPLFRNFLFIVIAVIGGMIALSELGVDIAPLFAGAGVVGLAIGFGAQALIRDIFSGAFFLMDDAFRKGEYIDLGDVKGTVEKISIRSMQLRHHMGPLHTIPFGEIRHLTNYSRDWVMMKLPLRLTYDTDVEKVRKLIKKLGQELLEHPELGEKFMQPLKSQGVYQMEDSAMIIRVKFMTRPGDQFQVRKEVYARIRALFESEGIRFAHREVTVRVAETPNGEPLTPAQKEAVAGAVRPAIEAGQPAKTGSDDR